jgi:hypothetical protein
VQVDPELMVSAVKHDLLGKIFKVIEEEPKDNYNGHKVGNTWILTLLARRQ